MHRTAFTVLAILAAASAEAQHTGKRDELHAIAACQAMRDHLLQQVEDMVERGKLQGPEAQPFLSVAAVLGRHCLHGHPHRVSELFSVVIDLMADKPTRR